MARDINRSCAAVGVASHRSQHVSTNSEKCWKLVVGNAYTDALMRPVWKPLELVHCSSIQRHIPPAAISTIIRQRSITCACHSNPLNYRTFAKELRLKPLHTNKPFNDSQSQLVVTTRHHVLEDPAHRVRCPGAETQPTPTLVAKSLHTALCHLNYAEARPAVIENAKKEACTKGIDDCVFGRIQAVETDGSYHGIHTA